MPLAGSAAGSYAAYVLSVRAREGGKVECVGSVQDAFTRVERDVVSLLSSAKEAMGNRPRSLEEGIAVLKRVRQLIYEDLNQLQHEYAILSAACWLVAEKHVPEDATWYWNPRQTGGADEPDLAAVHEASRLISAEVTTSVEPKGTIDQRMAETLRKLSRMDGRRFYFVLTAEMAKRARTKSRKAGWDIEVIQLPAESTGALTTG